MNQLHKTKCLSREVDDHQANQDIPVAFMEARGPLLCPQPTVSPSLKLVESSPANHTVTIRSKYYLEKNANYEASHSAVFFILLF
jgi:hypothetical protein